MTIESSGALGLNGTCTGGSSARNQIGAEVSKTAGTALCMNNSCLRTLSGTSSGAQISFNSFYGKSNTYTYTVSSNQTNFCMRAGAVSAGWNGTSKLSVVINSGVYISSNSTSTPAMKIQGSFPNGVTVTNSGTIAGMGGNGGNGGGGNHYSIAPTAGSSGGTALKVCSAVTFNNTSGIIAGGGGGGGGGAGNCLCFNCNDYYVGGGGGGGGRTGKSNSSGGGGGSGYGGGTTCGSSGSSGTCSSSGSGGVGGYVATCGAGCARGGHGGSGGGWGSSGSTACTSTSTQGHCQPGASGGGGGKATCGAGTYITWSGTGTRYGSIS